MEFGGGLVDGVGILLDVVYDVGQMGVGFDLYVFELVCYLCEVFVGSVNLVGGGFYCV